MDNKIEDQNEDDDDYIILIVYTLRNVNSKTIFGTLSKSGINILDVLTYNDTLLMIKIEWEDNFKYKKVIRDYCKNTLGLNTILNLKHLETIYKKHFYLVYIKPICEVYRLFTNTIFNKSKNIIKWKSFHSYKKTSNINDLVASMVHDNMFCHISSINLIEKIENT